MKLWLGVLLAIGCGSSAAPATGSGSAARPTITDPIGFCARARNAIARRKKCFAEDASLTMAFTELADLEASAPADPAKRRRVAVDCAVRLDSMARAPQPTDCPLDVTDDERAELTAFLAAWYGERTPAPKTGVAEVDTALTSLATQRDTACACKDLGCLRKASANPATVPSDAPKVAGAAAAAIADEIGRCKQRLVYGAPP